MRYKKTAIFVAVPLLVLVAIVCIMLRSNPTRNDGEIGLPAETEENNWAENNGETELQSGTNPIESEESESPNMVEQIPITVPVITADMMLGADGVSLDYADEYTLIFHDYFGLFVFDMWENRVIGAVDLAAIGCQQTQGDNYCEVQVSQEGDMVYLHPLNREDMYVYHVKEKMLTHQNYNIEGIALFGKIKQTTDCVNPDYTVWRSLGCVPLSDGRYVYLECATGEIEHLFYIIEQANERVKSAMIFEQKEILFQQSYDFSTDPNAFGEISPQEAVVVPEVPLPSFAEASSQTQVQQFSKDKAGTLPGSDEGYWYSAMVDGVEYLYGKYDYDKEGNYHLFSWALRDSSHKLANGLTVGITKKEALRICPNLVRLEFDGKGIIQWNRTSYPQNWTDEFDYMLIANIEDNIENLPQVLALMIKGELVQAITIYAPTAG